MSRTAIVRARPPVWPANLKLRVSPASPAQSYFYACAIDPLGDTWILDYNQVLKSTDCLTWTLKTGATHAAGTTAEGLFVDKDGYVYISGGTNSKIYRSTAPYGGTFAAVKCAGTETDFVLPAAGAATTGAYIEPWGFWQIEDERERTITSHLQVGDIIIGLYHRADHTNTLPNARAGYLYVLRGAEINAHATSMRPDDTASQSFGFDYDPFGTWNTEGATPQAQIVRHIHHVTMGLDGNLYFTCGDTRLGYKGTIKSATNPADAHIVVETAAASGIRTADKVTIIASYGVVNARGEHTVVATPDSTHFEIDVNGDGGAAGGWAYTNGWTISTPWAAGDTSDFYRFVKIAPYGGWTVLATHDKGYTAMFRKDDGTFLLGNDTGKTTPDGDDMPIDLYDPVSGTFTTVYTAGIADLDGAIWDIVGVGGDSHLLAVTQRTGSMGYTVGACLLESHDGGLTWKRVAISSKTPGGHYGRANVWADFDRIARDRKRRIPASTARILITTQPRVCWSRQYLTWYVAGADGS